MKGFYFFCGCMAACIALIAYNMPHPGGPPVIIASPQVRAGDAKAPAAREVKLGWLVDGKSSTVQIHTPAHKLIIERDGCWARCKVAVINLDTGRIE